MEAMIRFVDAYRDEHGVEPICRVLAIAPSTYHAHARHREVPETAPARVKRDAQLMGEIRRVFDDNFQVYGVRKIWRQMQREGFEVARCTVARLMRKMGLQGVIRGKRVRTTVADKTAMCPLDRVNRQFRVPRPNMLWVSDFTYVATWSGFVYVAFVIDAYARRIVGWRVSRSAHAGFVLDALEQALHDRRPVSGSGLVHHSDRGVQYVSIKYTERLAEAGLVPSVGSVGNSYDNALAETINGLYKAEVIHRCGPLAVAAGRRVRNPRMGRLVQQPPAPRLHRQRSAGGSRSRLPRLSGGPGHRRVTQTKRPPRKPERFTIAMAAPFAWLMSYERIPVTVAGSLLTLSSNPIVILLILNLMLLVIGALMDTIAAMIILSGVLTTVGLQLGMDMTHSAHSW